MVQGMKKHGAGRPGAPAKKAGSHKMAKKEKRGDTRKGFVAVLPKGKFLDHAMDDRSLMKAINKSIEQKVTAKLLQGGGKVKNQDLLAKGKELTKDTKRSMVKKTVGRVEQKLRALTAKAEADGLI
jgi:hypothetical protein